MPRTHIAILIVTAAAMALATSAHAGGLIPSTIDITHFPNEDADGTPESVAGVVTSPRAACEARRTVKIYWIGNSDHPQSSLILIDTVRTNANGAWSGGDVEPIGQGGKVKLLKKKIGPQSNPRVCAADTDTYD